MILFWIVGLAVHVCWSRITRPTGRADTAVGAICLLATIAPMPARLIAFFLAFALLWSGFSTFEAPNILSPASLEQQHDTADAGGRAGSHQGSVEDHHLDDLPTQVLNDPPTDAPELAPALCKPIAGWSARPMPHAWLSAAASSPLLAGPLRPPTGAAFAG